MKGFIDLLREAVARGASDLHLLPDIPPALRICGEIEMLAMDPIPAAESKGIVEGILTDDQRHKFSERRELGFSYHIEGLGHFRVNLFHHLGRVGAAVRLIPLTIPPLDTLGHPPIVQEFTRYESGLVLVTGPTGVGKTTTLNAMIEHINRERRCKIITVEDPVEYWHRNNRSLIVQKEIGLDTLSFGEALRHILREDPDVIGVGEMRDLETISTAITAAETGHLVIATLHTRDAVATIERIIDVFPPSHQGQIRMQLAESIRGIISQELVPRLDRKGQVLAYEILVTTQAVKNNIRENEMPMIVNTMMTNRKLGMVTMDVSLKTLYEKGLISYDSAVTLARDPKSILPLDSGRAKKVILE